MVRRSALALVGAAANYMMHILYGTWIVHMMQLSRWQCAWTQTTGMLFLAAIVQTIRYGSATGGSHDLSC